MTALRLAIAAWFAAAMMMPQVAIHGPISGHVFDAAAGVIRPIQGLPGAAVLGDPVAIPFPISRCVFAPAGSLAIVVSALDGTVFRLRLAGDTMLLAPVWGAMTAPDLAVVNETGTAALLGSREGGRIQFVRDLLSEDPHASDYAEVSVHGEATALALSEDGQTALVAVRRAGHGALYAVRDTGWSAIDIRWLGNFEEPVAVMIAGGSAFIADEGADEVIHVQNITKPGSQTRIAGRREGIVAPTGLHLAGSRVLLISSATTNLVFALDLRSRTVETIRAPSSPVRLEKIAGGAYFLAVGKDSSLSLIDAAPGFPVFFIPRN